MKQIEKDCQCGVCALALAVFDGAYSAEANAVVRLRVLARIVAVELLAQHAAGAGSFPDLKEGFREFIDDELVDEGYARNEIEPHPADAN